MSKIALIHQPAGLGDIFFLQKAGRYIMSLGYELIWPVLPQFAYIKDYIPDIIFIDQNEDFPYKNVYGQSSPIYDDKFLYLPFSIEHMKFKYGLMKPIDDTITPENWKTYFKFNRNNQREDDCRKTLGIKHGEKFIFVNDMFGSPPDFIKRDIPIVTNLKVIYNKPEYFESFTVFDFCWILENAEEIHTIETSLCYLVEVLNTKASLHMYSRKIRGSNQFPDFSYADGIYNKNWIRYL